MSLDLLLGFLFPNFWGNPTSALGSVWLGWGNYCEVIAYWGIVPLALSFFGFLTERKRGRLFAFAMVVLVLSFSMAYNLRPLVFLKYLPGLTQIVPLRWHAGIVLCGSILSALGLEHLLTVQRDKRAWSLSILALMAGLFAYLVSTVASPAALYARFSDYPRLISSHYWQIGLAVVTLVMVLLYLLFLKRTPRIPVGILVLGLTIIDLVAFGSGFNPYIAEDELYPSTPGIRFLQSQERLHRVAPWGAFPGIFPAELANVYGIQTITGHDHYRDQSYLDFLQPLMSEASQENAQRYGFVRIDKNLDIHQPLVDMLNTFYIVTEPDAPDLEQFALVYQGPDMRIYENRSAFPRVWGVPRYELVPDEQALSRVREKDFDARETVLLEKKPAIQLDGSPCDSSSMQSEILAYSSDEIIVQVDFACAGLLVFSERYSPGWQATLDGKSSEILRANYLLRAVAIPSGKHVIHLQYAASTYIWGVGISLFSFVLLCGSAGFTWKRWRGAIALGVVVPTLLVVWLGQPLKQPAPPAERWVEIDTPVRDSIAPISQQAILRDGQGEMAFLGYELNRSTLAPGETLRLTLYWRGGAAVNQNYTVFTHLLDDGQRIWAQKDQPPVEGAAPTSIWQEGQVVADIYHLTISPDTPATSLLLAIGMYDWNTGERVPLFDEHGNRVMDDRLILDSEIQIQP